MRNLSILVFGISIVLVSCKKDQVPTSNQVIQDEYISVITGSHVKSSLSHDCHDNSFTLAEQYRSSLEYRFAPGTQDNEKYFYTIEKRHIESYLSQTGFEPSWTDTSDWVQHSNYYRYSLNDQKAYLYSSFNDPSPLLLFDFNVSPGDTVNLTSHLSNFDVLVEIQDVTYDIVNNMDYPIVECKLVSCLNCYLTISPDLPNPYAFEEADLHVELNDSSNVPACIQTTGISYNRSAYSNNGQWVYSLGN